MEWARLIDALKQKDWKQQLGKIQKDEEERSKTSSIASLKPADNDSYTPRRRRSRAHSRGVSSVRIAVLQEKYSEDDYKSGSFVIQLPSSPITNNGITPISPPESITHTNEYDAFGALTPVEPKLPKSASGLFLGEMP